MTKGRNIPTYVVISRIGSRISSMKNRKEIITDPDLESPKIMNPSGSGSGALCLCIRFLI